MLWNGTVGLTAVDHDLPPGLTAVPLTDMAPSRLVVAWNTSNNNPLVPSFTKIAVASYRSTGTGRNNAGAARTARA